MTINSKIRIYFFALCLIAVLTAVGTRAWASGDCRDGSCNEVELNGGDTSVLNDTGGNRSLALGNVLGDVDIADCLGSVQWNTPLVGRQKLVLNQVCMAEFYLRAQRYELAAMALCNVPEILEEFDDEEACETAHDFTPAAEPTSQILEQRQEIEQYHEEDIEVIQMAQVNLEERLEALEQRPAPAPRVVRAPAPEPEPTFSEEQVQAAWSALYGDGEDEDGE